MTCDCKCPECMGGHGCCGGNPNSGDDLPEGAVLTPTGIDWGRAFEGDGAWEEGEWVEEDE